MVISTPLVVMVLGMVGMLLAEWLHGRRVARMAPLAFGAHRRWPVAAVVAPWIRITATGALSWGLATLLLLQPKAHRIGEIPEGDYRHLLLVLDVSPSMRLADAGQTGKLTRRGRAADLLQSFFERSPIELYKLTVVATYTDAKPVVIDTRDMEIVRNILNELPMEYAFKSGPTNLFSGLEEAAKISRPWKPGSTLVLVVSDGDSIPPTGMPRMPDSVSSVLVVGVGDPLAGKFIGGHQSRQDASSLRQLATRLRGEYHNGNEKHIGTSLITALTQVPSLSPWEKLGQREYALLAVALGAALLGLLPLFLHYLGSSWLPGVRQQEAARSGLPGKRVAQGAVP
ncbi:MAG: VWA domain-containing protein [Planctomycetota bacterium]|nr:VWA domain-containing protein [Planctomycetota bacterium]